MTVLRFCARVFMPAVLLACTVPAMAKSPHRPIEKATFGNAGKETVYIYTLTNSHGVEARIMTYGATIVSLKIPDRQRRLQNIDRCVAGAQRDRRA